MSGRGDGDFSTGQESLIKGIIAEAIADWERKRPKWYEVRKRLDTASALVVAVVLVGVGVANLAFNHFAGRKENFFQEASNILLGTDGRFGRNVEAWAGKNDFPRYTRDAIARIAADPDDYAPSPLAALVKDALETNPVMVFRASTTFGKSESVFTLDHGCHAIVSHLVQRMADAGPGLVGNGALTLTDDAVPLTPQVCEVQAHLTARAELPLPFIARLSGSNPDLQDTITLVLQVKRILIKNDGKEFEELTSTLSGLDIEYNSLDPNMWDVGPFPVPHRRTTSPNGFTQENSGFWRASLNGITKDQVVPTDDDKSYQHYHSITVRLADNFPLRDGEQIIIHAFVFVNTRQAG